MNWLRAICLSAAAGMMTLISGCGYNIGFISHPQLQSIAVAPVVNNTAIYNAASDMRMMTSEAVMQDGTFKLSDQSRADAVLFITVNSVDFSEVNDSSLERDNIYKPKEWLIRVTAAYKLIIPGQGKPLLQGKVVGQSRFQAAMDVEVARLRGVKQACFEAARLILTGISEGW